MAKVPGGIVRNNPGNIDIVKGVTWEGQSKFQTGRFVNFESPIWGIRAIARILITYADARKANDGSKIDTVREIIERWAPPKENNTGAYAAHVASRLNVKPDDPLAIKDYAVMRPLVEAIILHENGQQPYSAAQIDEGLRLAGIVPPQRPVTKDASININTISATAATVAGVTASVEQVWNSLASISPNLPVIMVAIAALVTVGACVYFIGRRLIDRKQGIA